MKIRALGGIYFTIGLSILLYLVFSASAFSHDLNSFKDKKGILTIAGGTAHIPVMTFFARKIQRINEQIHISVSGGGSSYGIKQVGEGVIDIGNSGRSLNKEEVEEYNLTSVPFALDGLAVVVHPSNSISDLTIDQVRKIFSGKIVNWREVGGADKQIILCGRNMESGSRNVFLEKMLLKGKILPNTRIVDSNNAMKVIISWDKHAIGYMSIGLVDKEKVLPISIDGIEPTQKNALNGSYKITRNLYMNLPENPSELARLFVEYVLSNNGRSAIRKAGFIPFQ